MIALRTILDALDPQPAAVIGPIERTVDSAAPITEAASEQAVTFCSKSGAAAAALIGGTKAGVIVCAEEPDEALWASGKTFVVVSDPRLSFLRIVRRFFEEPVRYGIHATAVIEPGATVHANVRIGPFTYVAEECSIGEGTVIYGHVHIYPKTTIGRNVTIHAGTVIGADGYGYQRNERGELEKFPHIGGVVIEDDVEIGSNTSIDRGTLGNTIIREGARIDNLVHVAHNVVVGKHAAVIANAMIGGSTTIGDAAWIAPSACLRDRIAIGVGAVVGLGAVVVKDVPDGATVMGAPARDAAEYKELLRKLAALPSAPE
ncbi:MAG TPA: UDP-3-O-(3-hydroxymyristoyl)glucosamine N-acyltransferase [Thermoanaerobaculia bacterium]|nr:UDP-3-O-(3-hydroxymyristoyl)glucosamine N-acyltransferase [Thermoanaerobaculia bacterium]